MNKARMNRGMSGAETSPPAPWVLFDTGDNPKADHALLLQQAVGIVRAEEIAQIAPAIEQLRNAIDSGLHAAGFFSYELGYGLEPSLHSKMPQHRQVPLIWFALFPKAQHLHGAKLEEFFNTQLPVCEAPTLEILDHAETKHDYLQRFTRAKELIAAGDIYQVNLAIKLALQYQGSPIALYADLRKQQPVSYGAFLECADFSILSHSPELFFELKNGLITARPMKGTIRRGTTRLEDQALSRELHGDVKNRAENLMIVDLLRNDLGRVCEPGSIHVPELFKVETYPTVHHLVSTISGKLRKGEDALSLLDACFPGGTITGVPKHRAMEIIHELEPDSREVYCGSIGWIGFNGNMNTNIAIRTLLIRNSQASYWAGGGIVADSVEADEYEETMHKAAAFLRLVYD